MIAFHGKPEVKEFYLARLRAHRAADDIIRGGYGDAGGVSGWRGCSIGCTLHSDNHMAGETELEIPVMLWHLNDKLFESIPVGRAPDWPIRFIESIPVGADLSIVPWQLLAFGIERMLPYAVGFPQVEGAIQRVLDEVLRPLAHGNEVSADAAEIAANAAEMAADATADAAVYAAADAAARAACAADAVYAVYAAVDAAARAVYAAARAADAAADAAAADAAEMDAWADELLRLLAIAPVA